VIIEALRECIAHLVVEGMIVRVRADDSEAAVRLKAGAKVIDKAVGNVKYAGEAYARGHVIIARAAGHKKNHIDSFLYIGIFRGSPAGNKDDTSEYGYYIAV
jgi:hypothetical protein